MEFITSRNINLAFYSSLFLRSSDNIAKKKKKKKEESVIAFTAVGMVSNFCQAHWKTKWRSIVLLMSPFLSMEQIPSVLETGHSSHAHNGKGKKSAHALWTMHGAGQSKVLPVCHPPWTSCCFHACDLGFCATDLCKTNCSCDFLSEPLQMSLSVTI